MKVNDFMSRIKELGLQSSSKIKIKKFWDGQPYYYHVGGVQLEDGNLIFNAMKNDYSSLDLEKIMNDIETTPLDGMVRVGSFKVHYIQPTIEGFSLVINTKKKKVSNLQRVLNFNLLKW